MRGDLGLEGLCKLIAGVKDGPLFMIDPGQTLVKGGLWSFLSQSPACGRFDNGQTAMCFSATASFLTASFLTGGLTGTIGIAALAQTTGRRQWPLAAMPLFFAVQQGTEGVLWLTLPVAPTGSLSSFLVILSLLMATVFWPIYVPTASASHDIYICWCCIC